MPHERASNGHLPLPGRSRAGASTSHVRRDSLGLLILDEPTSGLDPLRQQDVQRLIRERASAGRSVFFSSHALDDVQHVADRVGIIRAGPLIAVEHVAALRERALRRVEVRFEGEPAPTTLERSPGVGNVAATNGLVRMHVEGSIDPLIKELARHPCSG